MGNEVASTFSTLILDATATGVSILTGDPAAGRTALGLGSANSVEFADITTDEVGANANGKIKFDATANSCVTFVDGSFEVGVYLTSNKVTLRNKADNGAASFEANAGTFTTLRTTSTIRSEGMMTAAAGFVSELPSRFGLYTFATLPAASSYTNKSVVISDRAGKSAYSDGTDWRFSGTDIVVS